MLKKFVITSFNCFIFVPFCQIILTTVNLSILNRRNLTMEKVTNVAEICNLIRNKLIEYGVQEHTAWYDYNQNYRPVIYFFLNNEMEYNSKILARYQELVQKSLKRQPLIFLLSEIFLFFVFSTSFMAESQASIHLDL